MSGRPEVAGVRTSHAGRGGGFAHYSDSQTNARCGRWSEWRCRPAGHAANNVDRQNEASSYQSRASVSVAAPAVAPVRVSEDPIPRIPPLRDAAWLVARFLFWRSMRITAERAHRVPSEDARASVVGSCRITSTLQYCLCQNSSEALVFQGLRSTILPILYGQYGDSLVSSCHVAYEPFAHARG